MEVGRLTAIARGDGPVPGPCSGDDGDRRRRVPRLTHLGGNVLDLVDARD